MELQKIIEQIRPADQAAYRACAARFDRTAKPIGSLGRLEELLKRIAAIDGDPGIDLDRRCAFACPVDIDTDFVGHQRCWIMLCVTEPCREVLAHEFLGGERHIFVPERVERLDGSILLPETQRYCRQIQARKRILFHLSFIRRVCPVVIGVENSI